MKNGKGACGGGSEFVRGKERGQPGHSMAAGTDFEVYRTLVFTS